MGVKMPHTNRRPASGPAFKPAEFVNINLEDSQRQELKAQNFDMKGFDDVLTVLFEGNYKLTIRFDAKNDCFAAWIVAPDAGPNKGCILAGRGSTPSKAVKQVLFIHFRLLDGKWVDSQRRSYEEIDD